MFPLSGKTLGQHAVPAKPGVSLITRRQREADQTSLFVDIRSDLRAPGFERKDFVETGVVLARNNPVLGINNQASCSRAFVFRKANGIEDQPRLLLPVEENIQSPNNLPVDTAF